MSSLSICDDAVLVVGAGPTGMTLGSKLAELGVPVVLIDQADGPRTDSRAITVHPRTLEMVGVECAAALLARGILSPSFDYHFGGEAAADRQEGLVRLAVDTLETRYPHVVVINQDQTERVMRDYFTSLGGRIHWQRKLESVTRDHTGCPVVTVCDTADNTVQVMRVGWIVGCDGVYSTVRTSFGARFGGEQYSHTRMRMTDVPLTGFEGENRIHYYIRSGRMLLIARLPKRDGQTRDDIYRVLVSDAGDPDSVDTTLEAFQAVVDEHLPGAGLMLGRPTWGPHAFTLSRRLSSGYRLDERVFVAGDAAHTHSIIGGQGMNVSVQDAGNLAWKLALARTQMAAGRGEAAHRLLDSYERERRAIGEQVLEATHRLHQVIMGHGSDGLTLDQRLAIARTPEFGDVAGQVTGLTYHYPVEVAPGLTPTTGPAAGSRPPDTRIDAAHHVHDLLGRYFTLLVLHRDPDLSTTVRWAAAAARPYRKWLRVTVIASPQAGAVAPTRTVVADGDDIFDTYGADTLWLMRPDGYIAAGCSFADRLDLFAMIEDLLGPAQSDAVDHAGPA